LTPICTDNYSDITSKCDVKELIGTINYINTTKIQLPEFIKLKEDAIIEYKLKMKSQLEEFFENINKKFEICHNTSNKTIFTTIPDDKFTIINSLIRFVNENLDTYLTKELAIVTLQLLREDLRNLYKILSNGLVENNLLCAYTNDHIKLKLLCKKFDTEVSIVESSNDIEELYKLFIQDLELQYNQAIDKILDTIGKNIVDKLSDIYFLKLFTPLWENENITDTILIHNIDIELTTILEWLNESCHEQLLLIIKKKILSFYIKQLSNE
jgi:hypothetical protein